MLICDQYVKERLTLIGAGTFALALVAGIGFLGGHKVIQLAREGKEYKALSVAYGIGTVTLPLLVGSLVGYYHGCFRDHPRL